MRVAVGSSWRYLRTCGMRCGCACMRAGVCGVGGWVGGSVMCVFVCLSVSENSRGARE